MNEPPGSGLVGTTGGNIEKKWRLRYLPSEMLERHAWMDGPGWWRCALTMCVNVDITYAAVSNSEKTSCGYVLWVVELFLYGTNGFGAGVSREMMRDALSVRYTLQRCTNYQYVR